MPSDSEAPEADQTNTAERIARFVGFSALGVLSTTQQLAQASLAGIEGADPEIVAEETLCLVAMASARAAEVGLRGDPDTAASVVPALLTLPFTYHEYLVGGAMIAHDDASFAEAGREAHSRLLRKNEFYAAQFPPDQFPGERALQEKMEFWMGRISPPKLPERPADRLQKLHLLPILLTHLKLVLAYGRQAASS